MGNKKAGSSEERLSVFLSLVLRHQPEAAGITLDEHGWADVLQSVPASFQESPYDGDSFLPVIYVDYPSDHRLFAKSLSKS